jgi:hypothetical protein
MTQAIVIEHAPGAPAEQGLDRPASGKIEAGVAEMARELGDRSGGEGYTLADIATGVRSATSTSATPPSTGAMRIPSTAGF